MKIPYERRKSLYGYGFIAIWIVGTIKWFLIPLITSLIYSFQNVTPETGGPVSTWAGIGNNKYAPVSEHRFHTKLYEITGNHIITEFQDIIYPVLDFVKEKYRDFFEPIEQELIQNSELVTHHHLLEYIKRGDLEGYKQAIFEHFKLYTIYLERHKR